MSDYQKLMDTIQSRYPNFQTWRIIMAGSVGSGKSVAAASFPTPEDKIRLVLDFEDSMAFIDAGEDGQDVYTPRKQRYTMRRLIYPTLQQIAEVLSNLSDDKVGVLVLDNIAIFQDNIVQTLQAYCDNPKAIRDLYKSYGAASVLPFDSQIKRWGNQKDPGFWNVVKALPKALIMTAMKNKVHLIGTTEESNVWQNYGQANAKVIGKKAKILDIWLRYCDAVIMLKRDVNSTNPPMAELNPLQPKLRLQGFNPKWKMDWAAFTEELTASLDRDEPEIPKELQVEVEETFEES